MIRFCLPVLLLLCCFTQAIAQRTLIRGKVTDDKNNPLPGVSILVKGAKNGTATLVDGTFSLNVNDPATTVLRATMTGYEAKEMPLNGRTSVQFLLAPSPINLNNVVITGAMGLTKTQKEIGYASQTVDANNLTEARDLTLANALSGKVAGLQVTNMGQPGSSARVVIRGENSITQNNQPLYVIDGVPINNDMGDGNENKLDYGMGLSDINPDDIETLTILQGPNAAALYGSRAANGAVLITTKKGKIGDGSLGLSLNQNMQVNSIAEFPAYQNVYGEGGNGQLVGNGNNIIKGTGAVRMGQNSSTWGMPMLGQPYNDFNGKPLAGGYSPKPNNITDLYKNSVTNSSNVAISRADALSSFRLSYGYTNSNDVLKNANLIQKHNLQMNASRKVVDWLNIETRVMYTAQNTRNRMVRNLDQNSPMAAYVYLPRSFDLNAMTPWADANGNSTTLGSSNSTENPYWMLYENSNQDKRNRIIGGIAATINFTNKLSFKTQASTDILSFNAYNYLELGGLKTPRGAYNTNTQTNQMWDYQGMLSYNDKFGKDFSLRANVGAEYVLNNNQTKYTSTDALLTHDMPSIQNTTSPPISRESLLKSNVQSILGDLTLGYRELLYLSATGRNDWSSTLPVSNSSFFYPSVSGSFVFSNLLPESSILNFGKLRASYAQVGNAAPPLMLYTMYVGGLYMGNPYLSYAQQPNSSNFKLLNPNLKPEKTVSREVGLELSFFKSRIQLTTNIYKSNTFNQIIEANLPTETGYTTRMMNAGEMQNKGIEVSLNGTPYQDKNWKWTLRANWSLNRNKVISITPGLDKVRLGGALETVVYAMKDRPYGEIVGWGPTKIGDTVLVNSSNGRTIVDRNVYLGNFHPDWLGSIGSGVRYKNFDLSFLVTVKWGGKLYSGSYARANFAGSTVSSLYGRDEWLMSAIVLGENDQERMGQGLANSKGNTQYADPDRAKGAAYPNAYYGLTDKDGKMYPGAKSTIWMNPTTFQSDMVTNNTPAVTFDASSIKLSELIFGYSLPTNLIKSTPIKSARLAAVGRNLWTIFKNTPRGIDPESSMSTGNAQGLELGGSFPFSTYGFDLKLTF
ncbi:SusC/RagA family TonB-linked outer membrane protein [Chitinophaga silvatica]|uniref:SusC/RagA family TonB-linked outer membrane protein n=1 Tax=Chitinophaga silvatica TaxID=2282649 RepID=A0A3E1Y9G5_9BACT|nr:SusC/RagA family TonB-linked outer membrane protein [Chitinophaga silvatica]RFS21836.1 SusC/RagA family TonB-linked outer membrane protein [Chitinophaga silvatica]